MGFAGARLPIHKDGSVDALEGAGDDFLARAPVDLKVVDHLIETMVELVLPPLTHRVGRSARAALFHGALALVQSRVRLHQTDSVVIKEPLARGAVVLADALLLPDFDVVQGPHAQEHLNVFEETLGRDC